MSDVQPTDEEKTELALEIVHTVPDSVAKFIFEEGVRYAQALQTASHALDARATQVATILFAAAALSAGAIGQVLNLANVLAVTSAAFFIWGGLISFRSVQSGEFRTPGLPPAWWVGVLNLPQDSNGQVIFSERDALSWAAKEQQRGIDSNCKENIERADALNASLRAGFAGAVLIGISAALKLWPTIAAILSVQFQILIDYSI